MEEKIRSLKNKILAIADMFNINEIDDSFKQEIDKALQDAKASEDENQLRSIENWFYEQYYEIKKRNLRYIKFNFVGMENTYTKFYKLLRHIADSLKPKNIGINNSQRISWPAVDLAIMQIEQSCTDELNDSFDCWDEKIKDYYSTNHEYFYERMAEMVDLRGILDEVDDYYIKAIITKSYFDGFEEVPESDEDNPYYFLSRKSEQTLEIPLEKAVAETTDKFIDLVFDVMKALEKIIVEKYTINELMTVLEIDECDTKEFSEWYQWLKVKNIIKKPQAERTPAPTTKLCKEDIENLVKGLEIQYKSNPTEELQKKIKAYKVVLKYKK